MKKTLFLLLLAAAALTATPAAAQTVPPLAQSVPHITPPGALTSVQVYAYLVSVLGVDPFVAADVVTHSELTYGLYFTVDQALLFLPGQEQP